MNNNWISRLAHRLADLYYLPAIDGSVHEFHPTGAPCAATWTPSGCISLTMLDRTPPGRLALRLPYADDGVHDGPTVQRGPDQF
ncbi:hypothetical protein ACAG25_21485 [Mycobacterium sp. pV006]|uniref:hypothetical protein n=1 Tax=Mycobacterium sp. pV006 TaxID=3238983 RepID=UPI00351B9698